MRTKARPFFISRASSRGYLKQANNHTDTKMSDDEPLTKVAKTVEASPEAEEPTGSTADVTTTGGRRRGKRKVMKRVQSRDNEGYLGMLLDGLFIFYTQ